jgi:hypothetical protein
VAEAADGLAQAHRQLRDGLQALDGVRREALAASEQQLRVAQHTGELVVQFVAEDFAEVGGEFVGGDRRHFRRRGRQMNATLDARRGQRHKRAAARNKIGGARRDQESQLPAALDTGHDDNRGGFGQQCDSSFQGGGRRHRRLIEQRDQRLGSREGCVRVGRRSSYGRCARLAGAIEFHPVFGGQVRIGANDLDGTLLGRVLAQRAAVHEIFLYSGLMVTHSLLPSLTPTFF